MKFTQFTAARADNGVPLPYARATVYFTGTTVMAQLFNSSGTAISNPCTADATGLLQFAAADGVYDIIIVSADGSYLVPPIQQFQIIDVAGIKSTITSGRLAYANWSELSGVSATNGQVAEVPASDTGTHVDPVTSGNVPNSGIFRRESAGWRRIYDYGDPGKVSRMGDQMLGILNLSGFRIEGVGDPDSNDDVMSRGYSDARYGRSLRSFTTRAAAWALVDSALRKLRYIDWRGIGWSNIPERFNKQVQLLGGLGSDTSLGGFRLTAVGSPVAGTDAVNQDSADERYLRQGVDIDLGDKRLGGLAAPTLSNDAVRLTDFNTVSVKFPSTIASGGRTGIVWGILDAARRKLRYIDNTGTGWSYIPEKFAKTVQFLGSVSFSTRVTLTQLLLGTANVDFLSSYGDRSGYIRAWVDSGRRILFGLKRGGTVWAFGKQLATIADVSNATPGATYIPALLKPADGVADAWGDSLTGPTGGTAYSTQLATLIGGGFVGNVHSYGGRTSTHIAARMGAIATTLNASGAQINGNGGSTTITAVSTNLLWYPSDGTQSEAGVILCAGGSVHGTLTGTTVSGTTTYAFVSDAGTSTLPCYDGSLFIPDNRWTAGARDRELWLCVGRNNYTDVATVKSDVAAMVAMVRKTHKRIMLFGILNGNYGSGPGNGEYIGGTNWQTIRQLNLWMRQTYPHYYVVDSAGRDLRERLVASASSSTQDLADKANDIPPTSLRSDNIHLNTAGYGVWAQLAYEFRTANIV